MVLCHDPVGYALPALATIARPPQQRGRGRANRPAMLIIDKTHRPDRLRQRGDLLPALTGIAGSVDAGCVRVRRFSGPGVLRIHHVDILAVDAAKLRGCPALPPVRRYVEVKALMSSVEQDRHETGRAEEDWRRGDPFTNVGQATRQW